MELTIEGIFTTKKKAVKYMTDKGYPKQEESFWNKEVYDDDDFLILEKRRLQ